MSLTFFVIVLQKSSISFGENWIISGASLSIKFLSSILNTNHFLLFKNNSLIIDKYFSFAFSMFTAKIPDATI